MRKEINASFIDIISLSVDRQQKLPPENMRQAGAAAAMHGIVR